MYAKSIYCVTIAY